MLELEEFPQEIVSVARAVAEEFMFPDTSGRSEHLARLIANALIEDRLKCWGEVNGVPVRPSSGRGWRG